MLTLGKKILQKVNHLFFLLKFIFKSVTTVSGDHPHSIANFITESEQFVFSEVNNLSYQCTLPNQSYISETSSCLILICKTYVLWFK